MEYHLHKKKFWRKKIVFRVKTFLIFLFELLNSAALADWKSSRLWIISAITETNLNQFIFLINYLNKNKTGKEILFYFWHYFCLLTVKHGVPGIADITENIFYLVVLTRLIIFYYGDMISGPYDSPQFIFILGIEPSRSICYKKKTHLCPLKSLKNLSI